MSKAVPVKRGNSTKASVGASSKNLKTPSSFKQSNGKLPTDLLHGGDDADVWLKAKQLIKPDDQLELTENELKEEIGRILTTRDPLSPDGIVQFSFKERTFIPCIPFTSTVLLLNRVGSCLHKDSEEARAQLNTDENVESMKSESSGLLKEEEVGEEAEEEQVPEEEADDIAEELATDVEAEGEGGEDKDEDVERKDSTEVVATTGPKKITNQFNFCERAALTFNYPLRESQTQTVPPPRSTFAAQVTQWIIHDGYEVHYAQLQKEKEMKEGRRILIETKPEDESRILAEKQAAQLIQTVTAVKILERMVNQNIYDEIAQDYRYWEDPSDEYREEEGTLLPLWKFSYEKTKKSNVTDIKWNPKYFDLFAVAFGSYDFMKPQNEGAICLFSLKNPSYPEYVVMTESGVVSIDFNPVYPSLIVVAMYDGNVAVYNVNSFKKEPMYKSDSINNKHSGIIWQVNWASDLYDGLMNFYTVSSDGHVFNWVLLHNELYQTVAITLTLRPEPICGPDGILITLTACGTALVFHPKNKQIFLVGTEEGFIYKCSTQYSSLFLDKFEAHHMPIHKIMYNYYYPEIYISCSADWRVKIWEDNRREPLFVFDLGSPVGDVQWAPYSSTVFTAVTCDGKVHVFDINVNKYKAICAQAVVSRKRNKLTHIAINQKLPILLAGDEKGYVTSLKLSPNLRKKVKPPKKGPVLSHEELEIAKLEKLLALVREPVTLTPPSDVPETREDEDL